MANNLHNPFPVFLKNFKSYMSRWPMRVSQRAVLEIANNFKKQGYENESGAFVKWAPRKNNTKSKGRAILIKSGRLWRSPRPAPIGSMPRVVSNVPYADALNNGFKGMQSVRPHKRQATRTARIKGGYSGLGTEKGKGKKVTINGARHNVKGYTRKVNMAARPFMTTGPSFLNKEEKQLLNELENLFLQS